MPKNNMKKVGALILLVLTAAVAGLYAQDEITYDSGKRRDPFIPINPEAADLVSSTGVKLEGIIYDPNGRSMVVISGKSYQAGDMVGEVKILAIYKDRIVISENDEEKTLWMREEELPPVLAGT
ncbi:MAG TPA: hypothetical protein P5561_05600 [Candidatus Omnitrophota bacterium]|nr:hypothetical protein [Candidatus Omnitrophota bacterium]HRY85985.1 hypothetical protein [Candidatus Omnitrophota bacterium]